MSLVMLKCTRFGGVRMVLQRQTQLFNIQHHSTTTHFDSSSESKCPIKTLDDIPGDLDKDIFLELRECPITKYQEIFETEFNNDATNKLYKFNSIGIPSILIQDPLLSHELLGLEVRGKAQQGFSNFIFNQMFGETNLLAQQGKNHAFYRKQAKIPLTKKALGKTNLYVNLIINETNKTLKKLIDSAQNEYIDIFDIAKQHAWNVAIKFILGSELLSDDNKNEYMRQLFHLISNGFTSTNFENIPGSKWWQAKKARDELHIMIEEIIEEARDMYNNNKLDFDTVLYQYFNETTLMENSDTWDKVENVLLLMFAAHDTTATSFNNILYCIYTYPDKFNLLKKIIKEEHPNLLNKSKQLIYKEINESKYLDKFVKEVMRLISPVPHIQRTTTTDVELANTMIPSGFSLTIPVQWFHKSEKYWENPNNFEPDRFDNFNSQVFLAFGKGNRQCLGMHLAYLELKIFLILFIREGYTVDLDDQDVQFEFTPIYRAVYKCKIGKESS